MTPNLKLLGGTINAWIAKEMERKEMKDKGSCNVMIIWLSSAQVIHKLGNKLRFMVTLITLHKKSIQTCLLKTGMGQRQWR